MLYNPDWDLTPAQRRCRDFIALLRNPGQWPVGFKWDYGYYNSCGIGLLFSSGALSSTIPMNIWYQVHRGSQLQDADYLMLQAEVDRLWNQKEGLISSHLGIDPKQAEMIFLYAQLFLDIGRKDVRPEHLATALAQTLPIREFA